MKNNITEQLDDIAAELGAEKTDSENILEALEKIRMAVSSGGRSSVATDWPLADRMAKGTETGSVVEGRVSGNKANTATGIYAHAEGSEAHATGACSHAECGGTTASGAQSHAEGGTTTASGSEAHAEGGQTVASGNDSHAEGSSTIASGDSSHAEGALTTASGGVSHAEGIYTIANHEGQHVFGMCNIPDPSSEASNRKGTYVEIVGNGTSNDDRSNARTLDWAGNESLSGGLTLGMGTADETSITPAQLKALLALLS